MYNYFTMGERTLKSLTYGGHKIYIMFYNRKRIICSKGLIHKCICTQPFGLEKGGCIDHVQKLELTLKIIK